MLAERSPLPAKRQRRKRVGERISARQPATEVMGSGSGRANRAEEDTWPWTRNPTIMPSEIHADPR